MFRLAIRPGLDLCLVVPTLADRLYVLIERNRAHLSAWMPWVAYTRSAADVGNWIHGSAEQFARNEGWQAAICVGNEFAGCIGFKPIDWANRRVEIGYWLSQDYEGRGIMTECARFATNYAFCEWNLNRVEIHCAVDNHRSAAIPRRLGFVQEGILRQAFRVGDQLQDLLLFGMLREEWSICSPAEHQFPGSNRGAP